MNDLRLDGERGLQSPAGLYLCISLCMLALQHRVQAVCMPAHCAACWQMPPQCICDDPARYHTYIAQTTMITASPSNWQPSALNWRIKRLYHTACSSPSVVQWLRSGSYIAPQRNLYLLGHLSRQWWDKHRIEAPCVRQPAS